VRKLQPLLKKEFVDRIIDKDPDNLDEGDLAALPELHSRVVRRRRRPVMATRRRHPRRNAAEVVLSARQY